MQARTIPFIENKFPSFFVYRVFTIQVALSDRRGNISDNKVTRLRARLTDSEQKLARTNELLPYFYQSSNLSNSRKINIFRWFNLLKNSQNSVTIVLHFYSSSILYTFRNNSASNWYFHFSGERQVVKRRKYRKIEIFPVVLVENVLAASAWKI